MTTDVHNHVIPQEVIVLLEGGSEYRVTLRGGRWHGGNHVDFDLLPSFFDLEAKLAELENGLIDRAVVSVAPPLFYYELGASAATRLCEAANSGMAELHAAAPARLWWLAHVPMQFPDLTVRMLEQSNRLAGCVGVEVGSSIAGRRLDEPEFLPFWATVERLALPVLIHPDPSYTSLESCESFYLKNVIGMPLETTIAFERLVGAGVLERHPNVKLLLVHAGGFFPYQGGRLKHAASVRPELRAAPRDPWAALRQVWFDVITHDRAALDYLVSRVGADRVVLGTDMPFDMALPDAVQAVQVAVPAHAAQIMDVNPATLFGLPPEPAAAGLAADDGAKTPALVADGRGHRAAHGTVSRRSTASSITQGEDHG